jgi:general stress protein YciG
LEKGKLRGFAAMTPEVRAAAASKGGKIAHARGTAHRFTPAQAREAGRKGGMAAYKSKNAKGTDT